MLIDNIIAYAEIDEILNLLEDKYREKVPEKVRTFFKEEKMPDYTPKFDIKKPLIHQNLKRETIVLLAILNLNYWCDSEEEKEYFKNELAKNEKEKKELEEKYSPDNLFQKLSKDKEQAEISLVEYKERNFIHRLFEKIWSLFRRNK